MERLRPDGGDLILRQAQGAQHLPSEVLPDPPEAFREGRGGRIREAVLREVLGSRVFKSHRGPDHVLDHEAYGRLGSSSGQPFQVHR